MEKVQVTFGVSGPETVRLVRVPLVAVWMTRADDVQRLLLASGDGNAMRALCIWEGPYGALANDRADVVSAMAGDALYERILAHVGIQPALLTVPDATSP